MCDKNVLIKGYQPVIGKEGYQPVAFVQKIIGAKKSVSTQTNMANIKPPKGGTGEVKKK